MKALLITFAAMIGLSGCANLKTETIGNAFVGHAQFPTLSQEVAACLAPHPEIEAQAREPFNSLVDLWGEASELKPDASLLVALAGAQTKVAEAKRSWVQIKTLVVDAGIDCGPAVATSVTNIETTFVEIESAVNSNEKAVYVLQWANLLGSVVLGRGGSVTRI